MSIMPFSDALPDPLPVLTHAIAGYSNHNSIHEYCEKCVKPEDVVGVEEVKSSDEKLSEDEYTASDDEEIAKKQIFRHILCPAYSLRKLSCVVHDVQLQENSNTTELGNMWKNSYLPLFVITFHGCLCKLIHYRSIIQVFIHC
ncbi:hypothetical protein ES332_A08G168400v1 [Gossypium tomentosum]|uniref:Uncharacterized protein n=1 Tax=Gossypium tomentosum TaxID=34277 RepID=A0A5D2PIZ6_GOSTO|nr:hypothetical protein ES332_A08G168400v1 [Gossypium tomentosum]